MPIPDEKSRAWTRPEDYWPPRRPKRSGSKPATRRYRAGEDRGDPTDKPRLLLGAIPYALLMIGMAILAIAIMIVAWPGRRAPVKAPEPAISAEVGTAQKGWIDQR